MNCDDIMEIYHKSLRTKLSPDESRTLKGHLAECEECQNALSWDNAIVSALQSAESIAPQKDFVYEVCKKLLLPNLLSENNFIRNVILYAAAVFAAVGMTILWFGFWENVQPDYLRIVTYYSGIITENLHSFLSAIPEILLPQESHTFIPPNFTWLIWIVFAGSAYFVISSLCPVLPYSFKK